MPSQTPFRFQQFTVRDDRSAMKIGTDGVLLGAWTPIREARQILDVGTGCGLVALMIAQRTATIESQISAIDIEADAANQAMENFQESPWPNRFPDSAEEVHCSLQRYAQLNSDRKFDLVVCNPPFFEPTPNPEISARKTARTTESLPQNELFELSRLVLTRTGRLCLILPYEQNDRTVELATSSGFHAWTKTAVRPTPTSRLKRVLLEFGMSACENEPTDNELVVEKERHQYTKDYELLTRDFHLRYAAKNAGQSSA